MEKRSISERNHLAMTYFDQSEEWSLLNFLKYLDSLKELHDCSEAHRKYGIILNGLVNDERMSQEKRKKAKLALLKFVDERNSSEVREFWRERNLKIFFKETAMKSTERIIDQVNIVQDEASDVLIHVKKNNIKRLRSDFEIRNNTEDCCVLENNELRPCTQEDKIRHTAYSSESSSFLEVDEDIKTSEEAFIVSAASSSSSSDNDTFTFGEKDMELFTNRYLAMKDDKKWKLSTGTYVEDVLYDLGKKCNYHNLVHSLIIDPDDKFVQSGFTVDEIREIRETKSMQEPPEIDDDLLHYIDTFAKDSAKGIRKALYSPHPRLCENYDPFVDFAYEHVRTTVSDWVRLLEMEPNPLTITQDLPESWFRINVWRTLDIAFSDIPFTLFVGGEKAGLATRERKNRSRSLSNISLMQRKAIGRKGDGYVRSIGSRSIDWAASEAGPKWEGERGTKLINECDLILPKVLKDIFIDLARKIDFEDDKVRKINIPGFIHSGAILIKTNLDCPKGYVCRYMKEGPFEIYADVTQFNKTLDALVSIIYAKYVILQTMRVVNEDKSDNLKRWKNLRKTERTEVPDCHPTPKKRRVVDLLN